MIAYCTVRYGKINVLQYQRPEWLTEKYLCLFQQGGWSTFQNQENSILHMSACRAVFLDGITVFVYVTLISARVTHGRASVQV